MVWSPIVSYIDHQYLSYTILNNSTSHSPSGYSQGRKVKFYLGDQGRVSHYFTHGNNFRSIKYRYLHFEIMSWSLDRFREGIPHYISLYSFRSLIKWIAIIKGEATISQKKLNILFHIAFNMYLIINRINWACDQHSL